MKLVQNLDACSVLGGPFVIVGYSPMKKLGNYEVVCTVASMFGCIFEAKHRLFAM